MTVSVAPTFSQIKAKAAAVLKKEPKTRFIGIRAQGRWDGDEFCRDGENVYRVLQCDAPIQIRMAFQEDPKDAKATILITPLTESQLSGDLLARLSRQRLHSLNRWGIVRLLFEAVQIDPRVTAHGWIADSLLSLVPPEGYPPAPSGFLDAETVWGILLKRRLGMPDGAPDLSDLVKWSSDSENVARWRQADESFLEAASEWICQTAGPAGPYVLKCVHANREPVALPMGLVLGVVYHDESRGKLEKAAGRLEQQAGSEEIEPHVAERWHAASLVAVRRGVRNARDAIFLLEKADAILKAVGAESFAYLSDSSPLGFEQRMSRFGDALADDVFKTPIQATDKVVASRDHIYRHDFAEKGNERRMARVEMAVRLLRWLEQVDRKEVADPGSLGRAANLYSADGGFVDWARQTISAGDRVGALSRAYAKLGEACTAVREVQNKVFAELLRDWTEAGSSGNEVLPVEKTVEEIVAPLAVEKPVLLLLIDGMSRAVFEELLEDVASAEWAELERESGEPLPPVVAAIPSCTRLSRTSLFCGKLLEGSGPDEIKGFANHPALNPGGEAKNAPVLFHKMNVADAEDGSLSEEVRKKILSKSQRVVAVVVNAVDDHLSKGDQIDHAWKAEYIRPIPALLYEARSAGRVVVVLSDHGHVFENGTSHLPDGEGERWRPASDPLNEGEIRILGSRVLADGAKDLVALWTEKARYGSKKNGYHGGASPQEMIIPMALLSAGDERIDGWRERPRRFPSWWEEPVQIPVVEEESNEPNESAVSAAPERKTFRKGQLLFSDVFPEPEPEPEKEEGDIGIHRETAMEEFATVSVDLGGKLIASDAYKAQRSFVERVPLKDEQVKSLVSSLAARGGKMTGNALAGDLGIPEFRLRGFIAAAQRILNVDGYPVLHLDEPTRTVELNMELLKRQFELKG